LILLLKSSYEVRKFYEFQKYISVFYNSLEANNSHILSILIRVQTSSFKFRGVEELYLSTLRFATRARNSWIGPRTPAISATETDKQMAPSELTTAVAWHNGFGNPSSCKHSSPKTEYDVTLQL
jgi:hypothetical protein